MTILTFKYLNILKVGCFAVLWPKIFYPMLFGNNDTSSLKDGKFLLNYSTQKYIGKREKFA